MHFVKAKGILSSKNGMNLYRGCTHGCIYCDSRSKCYHMEHDFEDIEVKENAIDLLACALKRKRKKCMIGTGAMTDRPLYPSGNRNRKCQEGAATDRYLWVWLHGHHKVRPYFTGFRPAAENQ